MTTQAAGTPGADLTAFGVATVRKIQKRLLPFLFICYMASILDRNNIAFAALTMNKALAITAQQYGLLAGIFFIGYFLFEVPSNIIMHKIGARVWIARILITWGIVAGCTGLSQSATHVYIMRFLLGIAEAGFFPGIILYMTYWFRQKERAQMVALLVTAIPVGSIVAAPISGFILDHVHWFDIAGWRWMLFLEAVPAVALGVLTFYVLPSRPAEASFLTQKEKDWLAAELKVEEDSALSRTGHVSALKALTVAGVWYLAIIYFCFVIGLNFMNFFLPQVIRSLSKVYSNTTVGFLVMIPNVCGLIAMVLLSRHSDRTGERRFHGAAALIVGGIALLLTTQVKTPGASIVLLAVMTAGLLSFFGPFWTFPSKFLTGIGAASGIAFVNCFAQLGGFLSPFIIGFIQQRTGSIAGGSIFAGTAMVLGAVLVGVFPDKRQPAPASQVTAQAAATGKDYKD